MKFSSLEDIPRNEILTVELSGDPTVDTVGQDYVHTALDNEYGLSLPSDWLWKWTVTESRRYPTGTLPKRLARWAVKWHNTKLSTEFLEKLGTEVKKNVNEESKYFIDFDNDLSWQDGDFFDSGSCYWQSFRSSMYMLKEHGASAMRFWKPYSELPQKTRTHWEFEGCPPLKENACNHCRTLRTWGHNIAGEYTAHRADGLIGMGRTWVAPIGKNRYMLFNTYGEYQTVTSARLLASMMDLSYRKVDSLKNTAHENNQRLYVNNDTGYAVADKEYLDTELSHSYDFRWPTVKQNSCKQCGDKEPLRVKGKLFNEIEGRIYCKHCSRKTACPVCQEGQHYQWDFSRFSDGQFACADCIANAIECPHCLTRLSSEKKFVFLRAQFGSTVAVCETCAHNEFPACIQCGHPCISTQNGQCHSCTLSMNQSVQRDYSVVDLYRPINN